MRRRHRTHSLFAPTLGGEALRETVRASSLVVARYEPAMRQMDASAALDLTFERDGRIAVVPMVLLDCAMIVEPEDDAFVWPEALAETVPEEELEKLSAELFPWLRACSLAGAMNREIVRAFAAEESLRDFERARAYGFLGAAPYERIVRDASPCAYALRFAAGNSAGVRYENGATGAAILARYAAGVSADLGSQERNVFASRWYSSGIFRGISSDETFDVYVGGAGCTATKAEIRTGEVPGGFTSVPVPRSVPFAVTFSFDEDDGAAVESFGVRVFSRENPRRALFGKTPDAVGGSGGRILLGIRKDAHSAPDADSDDAAELARRLRAEGFTVDVRSHLADVDPHDYDLVHAFGLIAAEDVQWLLERARAAGRPAVLTPALEDVTARGVWGAGVSQFVLAMTAEERDLATYLQHLARHNLSTPTLASNARHEPRPGFEQSARKALAAADIVLASGDAEEALLRTRYGYAGPVRRVAPYLNTDADACAGEERSGFGEFVLCHAPIEPRCNQALLVRAAREAELPVLLAGPVTDAAYFELVREHAGPHVRYVPEPDASGAAALYGRARVFADAAWIGFGLRRFAQAAAYGCAIVAANLRYAGGLWRPGLWEVEPASVPSMAQGLRAAWDAVPDAAGGAGCRTRIGAECDPVIALVATVSAYAEAQARLNSQPSVAEI